MKRLVIAVIILGVIIVGGITLTKGSKIEYVQSEPQVVEKEVQVDALEQAIHDAQDAKKTDIESVAQKAWQDAYDQEMKKVELEVIRGFNEKLNARQIELEKETKEY